MNRLQQTIRSFFGPRTGSFVLDGLKAPAVSRKQLLLEYQRYVYPVVSAIAENFAKAQFEVYRGNGKTPLTSHPFLSLLRTPNPQQSQFQFLEMHALYMELMGESYWYTVPAERSRKPTMFVLLRPDMMKVVVSDKDKFGFVRGYVFTKPDGTKVPFDLDEILHFKLPNPYNPYYGYGAIQAGMMYIQTEQYASEFTRHSILNSGRPSGILNFKGKINEEEFNQIKKRFKLEYTGTANAGKTMMVNGAEALDYQKLGMQLGEVALKELKEMSRDDIMIMWRMSKTMLGISDDVNLNNAKESREVFKENVIKPRLDRFVDHINSFLMSRWDNTSYLTYVDPRQYDVQDKAQEWEKGHNKWLTTNDIRQERGLDPIEGGDIIYQPLSLVPMGERPELEPDEEEGEQERAKAKAVKQEDRREQYRLAHYQIQAQYERKFNAELVKIFDVQEKEILARNTKSFTEWLFDRKEALTLFVSSLTPIYQSLMKDEGDLALGFTGDSETTFDIDARVREYIAERINRFADEVNEETIQQLTQTLQEGVENGESLSRMRKRVEVVFTQARGERAERIARTETSAASNRAALEAYGQSPVVTAKEFYAQPDACEFCAAMNGKVIGLREDFFKVGQSLTGKDGGILTFNYEDVSAPPLHPNCKCALLPVYVKQTKMKGGQK